MNRNETRELMMQLFFQMDAQNEFNMDIKERFLNDKGELKAQNEYVNQLVAAILEHRDEVDKIIEEFSVNWKITRMNKVDLAVLRLSVTEIFYLEDIPVSVSINEAINLGKKFGTEESGKFINGILGKVATRKEEQ